MLVQARSVLAFTVLRYEFLLEVPSDLNLGDPLKYGSKRQRLSKKDHRDKLNFSNKFLT